MAKLTLASENKIAETLLTALYARAMEARQPEPMVKDPVAVRLVEQIDYDYSRFKLSPIDQAQTIQRVRQFDHIATGFLSRHPSSCVVNIGCGLDTRFERLDNGFVEWYNLDLPEVAELRRRLIPGSERCHILGSSVFDWKWIDQVRMHPGKPALFLAEGVFPYFTGQQVKDIFVRLANEFPGSELVCDAMSPFMVSLHNLKLILSKVEARLQWKLKDVHEPESWAKGIRLLDEWYYFDRPEPRLGASQLMRYIPIFARGVGVYHYFLNM